MARLWGRLGALPSGLFAGAFFGALIGGIGGRIIMRIVFLIDKDTRGAEAAGGTIGEFTLGGSFSLFVVCMIGGVLGGALYVGLRRWLPWSGLARGVFFGLLLMFGPGFVGFDEVDFQIVEPAVPILYMFVGLIVLYGVCVALLTDRLHAGPAVQSGARTRLATTVAQSLLALGIITMAVLITEDVRSEAGSCLSADDTGGCAIRATD